MFGTRADALEVWDMVVGTATGVAAIAVAEGAEGVVTAFGAGADCSMYGGLAIMHVPLKP